MKNSHRLSSHITPTKYKILIQPNFQDFSFTGEETIRIDVLKPTKELILHCLDINIETAICKINKDTVAVSKIRYNKKQETVAIILNKSIKGKLQLNLKFSGKITEQLAGFYRSKYHHKKIEKYLATTQFEATDARRAFPCFDEPNHKAVFDLSVVIPKHLQVVSNTTERQILHHSPGYKVVHFASTPKMSSYLLAYIIGELEHIKGKTKTGVQVRVHTTPGKKSQAKFALKVSIKALEYLENYFGIPFPIQTLDLIAIPDFSAGAMENWGAITFRETAILVEEQKTSFLGKQRVAEVIAHELVHQWFGNLVTMEWWTHLWLNESFANYMAYHVIDKLFPTWNFWTKFVLQEQSLALAKDALTTSQPVEVEVKHPSEINEIFDPAIVYAKGSCVLRMLEEFIGSDNFRNGLKLYLKKHSFKNTSSIHLWEAFEKVSKLPVKKFMRDWTTKSGFPVVEVNLHSQEAKIKQFPYRLSKTTPKNHLWTIPLSPSFGENINSDWVLSKPEQNYSIPNDAHYLNLNFNETSFFITQYDAKSLAQLILRMQDKSLSNIDRLAIVRSALLLAKSGRLSTDVYLEIISYLTEETSYIVVSEIASGLKEIALVFANTKIEDKIREFTRNYFSKLLSQKLVGYSKRKNEPQNLHNLRAQVIYGAASAGYQPAINFCKTEFYKRVRNHKTDSDLRAIVYGVSAKYASEETLNKLLKIYQQTNLPQEKNDVLFSLSKIRNPKLQLKVLEFVFSDKVRDQDRHHVLMSLLLKPTFRQKSWQAILTNWSTLETKYKASKNLGQIISGAKSMNTVKELKEFTNFVKNHNLSSAKLTVAQTLERIRLNIAWQKRDLSLLAKYLA